MNDRGNPFKIGDRVVFDPDKRTIGWTYSSFDRLRIHPGDEGIVTKLVDDMVFIDDNRGGFPGIAGKKRNKVCLFRGKISSGENAATASSTAQG